MKKAGIFCLIVLILCTTMIFTSCGSEKDKNIKEARNFLMEAWTEIYDESTLEITDRHFEIMNTRYIKIKENTVPEFEDLKAVVVFELLTNYYGSSPYYENCSGIDNVLIYKNGEMKVRGDYFNFYSAKTFKFDYSDIIESIDYCGSKYNVKKKLGSKENGKSESVEIKGKKQSGVTSEKIKNIKMARDLLMEEWTEIYDNSEIADRHFEIMDTRYIKIKDDAEWNFENVESVVIFELLTNYFGTSPYYENILGYNEVLIYKDGTMEVVTDSFGLYRSITYKTDYSDIIDSIDYCGDKYNIKKKLP